MRKAFKRAGAEVRATINSHCKCGAVAVVTEGYVSYCVACYSDPERVPELQRYTEATSPLLVLERIERMEKQIAKLERIIDDTRGG